MENSPPSHLTDICMQYLWNKTKRDTSLPILSDSFVYYRKSQHVVVELYDGCVKFFNNPFKLVKNDSVKELKCLNANLVLSMKDICGCKIMYKNIDTQRHGQTPVLTIYAYMRNTSEKNELMTRKRVVIELVYMQKEDYELNLANINMWLDKLNSLTKISMFDAIFEMNPNPRENNANIRMCERSLKPFLVFIDEKTIRGEKKLYTDFVLPVWSEANQKEKCVLISRKVFQLFKGSEVLD